MENQQPVKRTRIGSVAKRALILLGSGLALGLTRRPDQYFRILKSAAAEWQAIDARGLHDAIRDIYRSKLIRWTENDDGTVTAVLTKNGAQCALRYNLETIRIRTPEHWDELWRIVISDIPEHKKNARNAFAATLKRSGFHPLQKSVFVYPYPCDDELDFIIEAFELRPFVRRIVAQEIDNDIELRDKFKLPQR